MPVEYLGALVYLLIGVFFGELSLRVHRLKAEENAPSVKVLTYFFAILTWPVIVLIAVYKSGDQ